MTRLLKHPAVANAATSISDTAVELPQRPDESVLSESIALFYVGKNKHGFWVAREAEGRSGGLFLLQRSAVRFAQKEAVSAACALMILGEPLELDLENRGNRIPESLAVAMDFATGRAPALTAFIGAALAEWRKLTAEISRALAGERRNRAAIDRELFHGQYRLISKNDDDLPVVE